MSETVMGEAFPAKGLNWNSVATTALTAATRSWFVVATAGQWMFSIYVTLFYGGSAMSGHVGMWRRHLTHGIVKGDVLGNVALVAHLVAAVILSAGGAIQLIPQVRSAVPRFHRWLGKIYIGTAILAGISALYMVWFRGTVGDRSQHIGTSLNAVLILVFAVFALRTAMARQFTVHRQWALRLFLAVSGVWFFRVGLMLWLILHHGPVGFNPKTFTGPFITILTFVQFLLPLAVLELYLRVQRRAGVPRRFAMAGLLFVLTIGTVIGLFGVVMGLWLPVLRTGHLKL